MNSIAKTTTRSKKTRRLDPVQVMRADQYEALDVETKVECIRALIPLGLMHVQALLEAEVCTLAGARYARKAPTSRDGAMGVTRGVCAWRGSRCPCGFRAYGRPMGKKKFP